jgi:hypothetical protein
MTENRWQKKKARVNTKRAENNEQRTTDKGYFREKNYETHSAIDSVSRFFKAWR